TIPELKKVIAAFRRGMTGSADAYGVIEARVNTLLAKKIASEEQLKHLIEARAVATAKIYSGSVTIRPLTGMESSQLSSTKNILSTTVDTIFLEDYGCLCVHGTAVKLQKEARLLDLGVELLSESPDVCPLCTQSLDDGLRQDIHKRHAAIISEIEKQAVVEQSRSRVIKVLADAKENLKRNKELYESRTSDLISSMQPENEQRVIELFGGPDVTSVAIVRASAGTAFSLCDRLRNVAVQVDSALTTCESAMDKHTENLTDVETLRKVLQDYLATADEFSTNITEVESNLAGPTKLFRQAIDALAGTAEISAIIDLLNQRKMIERALHVQDILNGLKELKKYAEQTLAEIMEAAMDTDLTAAVMKWYSKIKTTGDPDVHFSGFAMDRTKSGDFKSRRLSVKAKSYGVELASAVSSLSESKLNALGLCVSIASAIRTPGPWSFLIIDDPIQSWDDEHETQFIDVIRSLVESEGKQVVVLSHNGSWANRVCAGCRTLNGIHYQIPGYTKDGPHIIAVNWSPLEERLREAEAITSDPKATSVRLQQAEEELRLAACQLASRIAEAKLGRTTSPHNMNKNDVRAILIEAGIAASVVDQIQAMFISADDAHHTPKTYQPNTQRIRQAIASLRNVSKLI
ncbi:MAG: hypothetical protein NT030_06930, partial [Candidatus Saganbacteria bacterium]|nr:hypothetical protein [Candidatus Saganbacteria bacterium]